MSKITDWNEVYQAAKTVIAQYGTKLEDYLSTEHCAEVFTVIYLTNDLDQAIGQNWPTKFSVISTRHRISVVWQDAMDFCVNDIPICGYEYIRDDMEEIGSVLDVAILRMESNMER